MRNWEDALKDHKQALLSNGFKEENILGIFCYGSQNYNLATAESDWDTKAVIVPSFEELVLERPISKEIIIELSSGLEEHCEVKDIREMVNMFKKQNINFIEILYTQYKWVNPIYLNLWNKYFVDNREEIAHYDEEKTLLSIIGQSLHTIRQNPTNGKKIANGYRMYIFLKYYFKNIHYNDCIYLVGDIQFFLMELKKQSEVPLFHFHFLESAFEHFQKTTIIFNKKNVVQIEQTMEKGIFELMKINLPKEK